MLKINCKTQKNLGKGTCPFTPGLVTMGFLAPVSNAIVTQANMADKATLQAFINAQLHHNDPTKRWHILGHYRGFEDMSEDIQTFTDEYGDKEVTDDVRYMYSYRLKNGISHHRFLRTFNKQHEKFVYFEVTGSVLHGSVHPDLDANGLEQMTGFDLNLLFAPGKRNATRTEPTYFRVLLGFADTVQVNDELFSVDTELNPLRAFKGVREVELKNVTPAGAASGVYHIEAYVDGKNIAGSDIGASFADAAIWIGANLATAAEVDLTTVARNATNTAYILTFDNTDVDYDTDEQIKIDLEPVADLETAGLKWFANSESIIADMD